MFGSKNKTDNSSALATNALAANSLNSLVKGTHVEGTVSSESDIRIDGTIKGSLSCKAKVIIGPTGSVNGEIRCVNAVIEGKFDGILHVAELLNVRETAEVTGDIYTAKLVVQSGANFNGACKMEEDNINGMLKGNNNNVKAANGVVDKTKT